MQHRKRPVRVVPKLYRDGYANPTPEPEGQRKDDERGRRAREYREEVERLEQLTTKQLMAVARKEHARVELRYGRGQRQKFIKAIARKRLAERSGNES